MSSRGPALVIVHDDDNAPGVVAMIGHRPRRAKYLDGGFDIAIWTEDTDGNLRGPEQLPLPPSITRAWAQTDTEADTKARAMIHNAHTRLTHCGRGPCTLPGYHDGPCSY